MKKQSHTLLLVAGLGIAAVVYKQRMDAQKAAAAQAALAAQAAAAAATPAPAPGSMLPGMNGADVLLTAPTGETVASSGQVLGWLGEGYETNDTYDAAPSQYMSRVVNDLKGLSGLLSGAGSGGGLSPIPTVMQATTKPVAQTVAAPVAPPATPGVRTAAATVAASSPAAAGAVAVGAAQGYTLIEQYGGNHSIWQNSAGQFVTDYTTVPRVSFSGPYPSMAAAEAAIDGVAAPAAAQAAPQAAASQAPAVAAGAGIPASAVIASSPAAAGAAAVGAAAGLTLVENYGGNHSIWSQAGGTQFVTDYTTVPSPTYALGPFSSVAAAEQGIDQAGWTLAASTLNLAQTYTSPVGPAGNTNVIYTMTPTPGAGAVYLVNPPQPANPSTQLPTSDTSIFAASYPTLAAATAAVDAYYSANYAATGTVPTVQTPGMLAQPVAPYVTFVQNYGGHNIATYGTGNMPAVYIVDPPANSVASAPPFTTYGTLAVATAAIDAQNGTVSAASTGVLSTTPGGTIAPPILIPGQMASGVSFAQSYGGHNIYTYAPAGVGAVYIIDPAIGGTISAGQFLSSYPTMLAATQAIDAANAALTAAMSSEYGSSTDSGGGGYTDDGASSAYSADGSVPMTTQPAAAAYVAPAPASGNGAVTVVVGGALVAGAAYYFLGK